MGGRQFSLPEWVDSWFVDLKNRGVADPKEVRDILSYINSLKNTRCDELKKLRSKLRDTQIKKNEQIANLKQHLSTEKSAHSMDTINLRGELATAKERTEYVNTNFRRIQAELRHIENKGSKPVQVKISCDPSTCKELEQAKKWNAELGRNTNTWHDKYKELQIRFEDTINRYGKDNGVLSMVIKSQNKEIEDLKKNKHEVYTDRDKSLNKVRKEMQEYKHIKNKEISKLELQLKDTRERKLWFRFKRWFIANL